MGIDAETGQEMLNQGSTIRRVGCCGTVMDWTLTPVLKTAIGIKALAYPYALNNNKNYSDVFLGSMLYRCNTRTSFGAGSF